MAATATAAAKAVKRFRVENLPRQQLRAAVQTKHTNAERPIVKAANPFLPSQIAYNGHWVKPRYSLRRQKELVKKAKMSGMVGLLPPGPKLSVQEIEAARLEQTVSARPGKLQDWWLRPVEWSAEPERTKPAPKVDTPTQPILTSSVSSVDEAQQQAKARLRQERAALRAKRREMVQEAKKRGLVAMYIGRKRMFKGHKWERVLADRRRKHRILMRDMGKRVQKYKSFYRKRRPSPLAVPRANNQKLPF